ncbi:MAG: NAD(P)-dependent oxidoreductase [Thermoguttaceae bacterium]|nr:NAD(P)-dependent oxidoreductase [Thermoguttaceae bacterium]MDW8079086.1 NAD(P)-dependent oxidoreductase [Thermoguttaceae bacterium]
MPAEGPRELGFIGIGQMGRAMVENWLADGFRVRVFNRTRDKILPLLEKGAIEARSPAEAAIPGGILMSCVADDAALLSVFEDDEVFRQLGPTGIHVSMSTILPQTARLLAERHAQQGGIYVAAPVMGRPDAVAARRQTYYLSGPPEARQRVKPVLSPICRQVLELGDDPGAAHVAKLASNFLIATVVESLGEAFALVEKSGLPSRAFFETITEFLFNCYVYKRYGEHLLSGRFSEPLFRLQLGFKDMQLLAQMAASSHTPMPFLSTLRDRYLSALAQGKGEWDWTAIVLEIRRQAGLADNTLSG